MVNLSEPHTTVSCIWYIIILYFNYSLKVLTLTYLSTFHFVFSALCVTKQCHVINYKVAVCPLVESSLALCCNLLYGYLSVTGQGTAKEC